MRIASTYRNVSPLFALLLLSLTAAVVIAEPKAEGLKARHDRSIATAEGQKYEERAIGRFWGDAAFMRECVPPGSRVTDPLTIYFEVGPDGTMGQVVITPPTAAAKCIRRNVQGRRFDPPPSSDFVVRIDLKFKE